jgi:hypothetical protein
MRIHPSFSRVAFSLLVGLSSASIQAKSLFVSPTGNDAVTYAQNDLSHPWRTLAVAGKQAQAGDVVYIYPGSYTTPLVVSNSGSTSARITFQALPNQSAKVYLEGVGVVISGKSNITIQGLNIRNVPQSSSTSGIGIVVEASRTVPGLSTYGVALLGNTITNTYGSAIGVWGAISQSYPRSILGLTIAANVIEGACNGGWNEAITIAQGVDTFTVANNIVRNSLSVDNGGEGIDVKEGPKNGQIFGNTLYGLKRNAIYIDAGIANTPDVINLPPPVTKNIKIYNNKVYGNLNWAHGITVTSEGRGNIDGVYIYNNLVYKNSGLGINLYRHEWMDPAATIKNVYVVNNSLADNGQIRNVVPLNEAPWFGNIEMSNWRDVNASVPQFQNIWIKNNATQMSPTFTNAIRGIFVNYLTPNQVFVSNNSDTNVQDDTDSRIVIFTNVDSGDLTLRAGAPAIDRGVAVAPYTDTDILGVARPKGAAIDLGAYEQY